MRLIACARVVGVLVAMCLAACSEEAEPAADAGADSGFFKANPFVANSAWPMTHGSSYAQSSTAAPGPGGSSYEVQHVNVKWPSITLAFEPGGKMLWGSNLIEVYRMRVADPPVVTARVAVGGNLTNLFAGAYTVLDRDGRLFTTVDAEVRAYEADGSDAITAKGSFRLPKAAGGEVLRGLGLTYDGTLIALSSAGRVVAIHRKKLTLVSELWLAGDISNSMAIDEDGGIYVVTSKAMHRVQWTGSALSTAAAHGAWQAAYETGAGIPGGRLGGGSGSTPSLMNVGDDRLVLITDAQPLMHLVAFWRGEVPAGWKAPAGADPRTAGRVPVTFGDPKATSSVSEQSVLVMGDGAVVVNNDYGNYTGFQPIILGIAPPGIEKFVWDAKANTLKSAWSIGNISCPNGIPSASSATGLMYCVGKRGETWTIEAINWKTGSPAFHVKTGKGNDYNSVYAATEVGPNGEIWTGTFTGVVRVRAVK